MVSAPTSPAVGSENAAALVVALAAAVGGALGWGGARLCDSLVRSLSLREARGQGERAFLPLPGAGQIGFPLDEVELSFFSFQTRERRLVERKSETEQTTTIAFFPGRARAF